MPQDVPRLTHRKTASTTSIDPDSPTLTIPVNCLPTTSANLEVLKTYLAQSKYESIESTSSCWRITFANSKKGLRRCEFVFKHANNHNIGGHRIKMQMHASGTGLASRLQLERERMSLNGSVTAKSSDYTREKKRRKLDSDGDSLCSIPASPSAASIRSMEGSVNGKPPISTSKASYTSPASSPRSSTPNAINTHSVSTPRTSTPQTTKTMRPRVSSNLRQVENSAAEPDPVNPLRRDPTTNRPSTQTPRPALFTSNDQRIAQWVASSSAENGDPDQSSTARDNLPVSKQSSVNGHKDAQDLTKPERSFIDLMVEVMNKPDTPQLLTSAQLLDLIRGAFPYYAKVANQVKLKNNLKVYLSQNPRFVKGGFVESPSGTIGGKACYWSLHPSYSTRPQQGASGQVVKANDLSMNPPRTPASANRGSSASTNDDDRVTRVDEMYYVRHDRSERFEIVSKNSQVKSWNALDPVAVVENMDDTYKAGDIVKVLVESGDEDFSFAFILELRQINEMSSAASVLWFMSRSRAFRQCSNRQKRKWPEGDPCYRLTCHVGVVSIQTIAGKVSDAEKLQIAVGPAIVDIGEQDYVIRSLVPECEKEVTWVKKLLSQVDGAAHVTQGSSHAPQNGTSRAATSLSNSGRRDVDKDVGTTQTLSNLPIATSTTTNGKRKRENSDIDPDDEMSTYRSRDTPWKNRDEVAGWLRSKVEARDVKDPKVLEEMVQSLSAQRFLLDQEHEDMIDRKSQQKQLKTMEDQLHNMQQQLAACLGEIKSLRSDNEQLRNSHKADKEAQNGYNKVFKSEIDKLRDRLAKIEAPQSVSRQSGPPANARAATAPVTRDAELHEIRKQLEALQAASKRHEQVMNRRGPPTQPGATEAPSITHTDLDDIRQQIGELTEGINRQQQCTHDKDVDCPWAAVATRLQSDLERHETQIAELKSGRLMKSALFPVIGEPDNVEIWRSPFKLPPNALIYHLKNDERMWCRADERNTDGTPKYPTPGIPMIKVSRDQLTKAPPITYASDSEDDDGEVETTQKKHKRPQAEAEDVAMLDET